MSYEVRNARRQTAMSAHEFSWNKERGECFQHDASGAFSTVEVLHRYCEVNGQECDYAAEYGEPGYTTPERGILFCNWNHIPKTLANRLKAQGYELEWSDEWIIDYDHSGKAYRGSPDSHGWEPRVRAGDGFYLTPESDAQEWIDDSLNEDNRPLPSWFDDSELESRGFTLVDQDDRQVGFHPGQNETPEKFTPALRAEGRDYILQITDRGQFVVRYRVWTRKEESQS